MLLLIIMILLNPRSLFKLFDRCDIWFIYFFDRCETWFMILHLAATNYFNCFQFDEAEPMYFFFFLRMNVFCYLDFEHSSKHNKINMK